MYNFDPINYSLRPNKVIQRQVAFDGLAMFASALNLARAKYVGFGSIWFADFILAHKRLGISDMLSVEVDEITYKRAKFNAPFRTITVGGVLPGARQERGVRAVTERPDWPGFPSVPIETPPLTPKELTALQRVLPSSNGGLTDGDLARLGFALEPGMLDVYCAHYRRYPSFFQVVA